MTYSADPGASQAGLAVFAVFLVVLGTAAYFAPTIIAWLRHQPGIGGIAVVNALVGWTFIGWLVALVMACRYVDRRPLPPPYYGPQPPYGPSLPYGQQSAPYGQPTVWAQPQVPATQGERPRPPKQEQ